ncbi:MAG: DeoR/GlpR family DNA-binding transcription regulator [Caldilineaceae bacterium]
MSTAVDLYLEERRQVILADLARDGRVTVAELSRRFGVSEVTIRSDLQALAEQGLVVRTHGGAVPSRAGVPDLALAARRTRRVAEKERIGAAAAAMVPDGAAVFLDSSSTSLEIARRLKAHRHTTILTNSLAVAQEMLDASGVRVVMSGGALQPETASLIGADAATWFGRFNIQFGFFGAHGISDPEGLTDVSLEQAEVKRPLVQMCRQVVAVVDSSKWGQVGVASFAELAAIDTVITDAHAPAEEMAALRAHGIDIQIASSSHA